MKKLAPEVRLESVHTANSVAASTPCVDAQSVYVYFIPEIPSPVLHAGRLYLARDGGLLSCMNAATGAVLYRERLGAAGQYIASPVIAHGHVCLISSRGVLTVVKCGDKFAIAHQADLGAAVSVRTVSRWPSMRRKIRPGPPGTKCTSRVRE